MRGTSVRQGLLAIAVLAVASAASAQTLAKHAFAFKGGQGLKVVVAPTTNEEEALVQLSGINHPIDGVVLLAKRHVQGDTTALRTVLDGRERAVVVTEDWLGWFGGRYQGTMAMIPGQQQVVNLTYDEAASKGLSTDKLLKTYQQQKKQGVQDKLARFDRDQAVSAQQRMLADKDSAATQACGAPVKTTVDWAGLDQAALQSVSISGYCATVAEAMQSLCKQDAGFKSRAAEFGQIQCQFGERLNLTKRAGGISFTTAKDAVNQDDFALQFLRNQ